MVKKKLKKGTVQVTPKGFAHITAGRNNLLLTITNLLGQTVVAGSAGMAGFKGSKKNTPYAASQAARDCAERAFKKGVREVIVRAKGFGSSRESAIRALGDQGLKVTRIQDCTPQPHNGCRPAKRRVS